MAVLFPSQFKISDADWLLSVTEDPFEDCEDIYLQYKNATLDDINTISQRTHKFRESVWNKWLVFSKKVGIDPNKTWINLSLDEDSAKNDCRAFLHSYVVASTVWRPCLGPEEWYKVRTVTCAVTVEDVWAALVQSANAKVLKPMSKKGSQNAHDWELRFSTRYNRQANGPAYDIAKWIPQLALQLGLSLKQTFTKRQMTTEDVLLFLDILWTRSKVIGCTPTIRSAFHCAILLGAFGGWRPGSLMNIKYKDVQIGWFCHPKYRDRIWPIATITIHHVKQRKNKVERTQRAALRFTITLMNCRQLCLITHLVSRALADNAFEMNFTSPAQVLDGQPFEAGIYYVPLKWKLHMLQKEIVPISYSTYNKIWHKTLFAAGLRDTERVVPYSMRVGAGRRLDESLTGPLRNFVLNHSSKVFEQSYMPLHLSEDLAQASFGELAGRHNDITLSLSRALINRDQNAPVYIKKEDIANFEKRKDVRHLRQLYNDAKTDNPHKLIAINRRLSFLLDRLTTLKLKEVRNKYFEDVDKMRAEGKSINYLVYSNDKDPRSRNKYGDSVVAARIGMLLRQDEIGPDIIMEKLIGYLTDRPSNEIFPQADEAEFKESAKSSQKTCRCLLCNRQYKSKFSLNRHFYKNHQDEFNRPFSCKECLRSGTNNVIGASLAAWNNHVERFHGKMNAPNIESWSSSKYADMADIQEKKVKKRARSASAEDLCVLTKKIRWDSNRNQESASTRNGGTESTADSHNAGEAMRRDYGLEQKSTSKWKQRNQNAADYGNGETTIRCDPEKNQQLDFTWKRENESTADPHNGEEFYVTGCDELDE